MKTEADSIMPAAPDVIMPCQGSESLRTKANGSAPRPVARSVMSATQKTCQTMP